MHALGLGPDIAATNAWQPGSVRTYTVTRVIPRFVGDPGRRSANRRHQQNAPKQLGQCL